MESNVLPRYCKDKDKKNYKNIDIAVRERSDK